MFEKEDKQIRPPRGTPMTQNRIINSKNLPRANSSTNIFSSPAQAKNFPLSIIANSNDKKEGQLIQNDLDSLFARGVKSSQTSRSKNSLGIMQNVETNNFFPNGNSKGIFSDKIKEGGVGGGSKDNLFGKQRLDLVAKFSGPLEEEKGARIGATFGTPLRKEMVSPRKIKSSQIRIKPYHQDIMKDGNSQKLISAPLKISKTKSANDPSSGSQSSRQYEQTPQDAVTSDIGLNSQPSSIRITKLKTVFQTPSYSYLDSNSPLSLEELKKKKDVTASIHNQTDAKIHNQPDLSTDTKQKGKQVQHQIEKQQQKQSNEPQKQQQQMQQDVQVLGEFKQHLQNQISQKEDEKLDSKSLANKQMEGLKEKEKEQELGKQVQTKVSNEEKKDKEIVKAKELIDTLDTQKSEGDQIDPTIGELLGQGAYGKVYKGFVKSSGRFIAVKEMKEEQISMGGNAKSVLDMIYKEIQLLKRLQHKNIVRYIGSKKNEGSVYIFMEYMSGGSISEMLKKFGPFDELVLQKFVKQLLEGLVYLHSQGVIHRDIKGANILSDGQGNVKLADFGAAGNIETLVQHTLTQSEFCNSIKGSLYWMAPELIRNEKHGRRIDVWSLGCAVIEMATASHPWPAIKKFTELAQVVMQQVPIPIPEHLSKECQDFIAKCCTYDKKKRPKTEDLILHPFILKDYSQV